MPYDNQHSGKSGHIHLVKNPDVQNFLQDCRYMRDPTEQEGKSLIATFAEVPTNGPLPEYIIASDASPYSKAISDRFPSTQVGYVKMSLVMVSLKEFDSLTPPNSRYVDPFKAAKMHRNADTLAFTLPGSNIRYKDEPTVKDGFRRAVYEQYSADRTNPKKIGPYRLIDTLLTVHGGIIHISKCPSCRQEWSAPQAFDKDKPVGSCNLCGANVYVTDDLRIHEQITDHGDCGAAITRFMNVTEHLMMASCVRIVADDNPRTLGSMGFILDGPLAIFGQPADIHKRLMVLYDSIAQKAHALNLPGPLIIGIQKDGQVMEHARSLAPFFDAMCKEQNLTKGFYRVVDDEYRGKYISEVSSANFGNETYYGQDFIYRTETGRIFTFAVPYPFSTKSNKDNFSTEKAKIANYKGVLSRAMDLIRYFEFDLYNNAVVPIALAHRHASISLVPGGKVLDIMTRAGLG